MVNYNFWNIFTCWFCKTLILKSCGNANTLKKITSSIKAFLKLHWFTGHFLKFCYIYIPMHLLFAWHFRFFGCQCCNSWTQDLQHDKYTLCHWPAPQPVVFKFNFIINWLRFYLALQSQAWCSIGILPDIKNKTPGKCKLITMK